jgi:hypothetical protein
MPVTPDAAIDQAFSTLSPEQLNGSMGFGAAFDLADMPGAMPVTPDAAIDQAFSTLSPEQLNGSMGFGAAFDLADMPGAMPIAPAFGHPAVTEFAAPPAQLPTPSIAGPIAPPSNPSPVVSLSETTPSPTRGEGLIPTVQPPTDLLEGQGDHGYYSEDATAPFDPLAYADQAAIAGFGDIAAPPLARGLGAPLGWGDLGRAVMGGLFGGPVGAIAAPLLARGIGSIQNAISAPRPPSLPTHAVLDGMGNIIGFGGGGFEGSGYGGAGFGGAGGAFSGAANDAFSFSGGMPGMGHYGGPNPGPTDPDYGYA